MQEPISQIHRNPSGDELLERLQLLARRMRFIAHDLNNMLGAMIGYGALVLDDLPESDPNRAFVAKVMEAGEEANRLVAELLESAHESLGDRGVSRAA